MENFYSSEAETWQYKLSNISNLPTSWGLSKNSKYLYGWYEGNYETVTGVGGGILNLNDRFSVIQNGTIDIFGTTFDCYSTKSKTSIYTFPSIYIYKNNTHLISNNPTTLKIKDVENSPVTAKFTALSKSFNGSLYPVCILINDYYYQVYIETDVTYKFMDLDKYNMNIGSVKTTLQPYETINLDSLGLDIALMEATLSSASRSWSLTQDVNCKGWEQIKAFVDSCSGYPSLGYFTENEIGKNSIKITYGISTLELVIITVTDWGNKVYDIKENETDYKIYCGKEIGEDFLNHFSLTYTYWNEYKSITGIVQSSLDKDCLSKTKFSSNEDKVEFEYIYDDKTATFSAYKEIIKLSEGDTKFNNLKVKSTFKYGEYFDSSTIDIKNSGYLTYEDGTTIALSEVEWEEEPSISSSVDNPILLEEGIESFELTYNMPTRHFGMLAYTVTVIHAGYLDDYTVKVELQGAQQNIKFNSVITLLNYPSAILVFYNHAGDVIKNIPISEANKYIAEYPEYYGKVVPDIYKIDEPIVLTFKINDKLSFDWTIYVSYYENKLSIDTNNVKKRYYVGGDYGDITLDASNIIANAIYHENTKDALGNIRDYDVSDKVSLSCDTIDVPTGSKVYVVNASYTDDIKNTRQTITNTYEIVVVRYEPKRIEITGQSDSIEYWNNNTEIFHYPAGLNFNTVYSDGTLKELSDLTNLIFYRDAALKQRLIIDSSIIKESDGSRIYVYDNETKTSGSYIIQFKRDTLENVILSNDVNFVLGNRFQSIRNSLSIQGLYASGVVEDITEYSFKNNSIILEEQDLVIIIDEKEFTLDSSKINFIKPNISSISLNTDKFPLTYNNISDSINASTLAITIAYEDAIHTEDCHFKNGQVIESDNEFLVTCDQLPTYEFNGSQDLNLDSSEEVERVLPLNIIVRNRFDNENTLNNSTVLEVKVIEITEITGISLVKIYKDYHVNDTFLNENDDTEVNLFYKDASGMLKRLKVKLNSDFSALNIFPLKGEKFTTISSSKTIKITSATNSNVSCEYTISVSANYNYSTPTQHELVAVYQAGDYTIPNGDFVTDKYLLIARYDDDGMPNTIINSNGVRVLYNKAIYNVRVFGYLDDIFDTSKNARVILFEDYIGLVEGTNNITVKYPCYVESNADIINKCKFGILFGNNNAKNRLFVSGNEDFPNCDWHSGQVDSEYLDDETMISGNFGYFEDTSYCYYGETDNAIVGYDIVSNDKLLVLKNKSDKETTVYFRTPTLVQAIDASGTAMTGIDGEALYQEEFPLTKGNNSIAAVSPRGIINFNGDSLFLSEDKNVIGLDLTGIVGDNQRYANTRSYLIDEDLKKYDMNEAWLWSNNKDLYLILKDKIFFTNYEAKGESQYEWWVMNIKDIQSIIEVNNQRYLANSEGQLYKITSGYDDINKIFIGKGGSTLISQETYNDEVVVSQEVINKLEDNVAYTFKIIPTNNEDTSYMYYQLATVSNSTNGPYDFYVNREKNYLELKGFVNGSTDISVINELLKVISESKYVYLNHLQGNNEILAMSSTLKTYYKKYYLKRYYTDEEILSYDCYKLIDAITGAEVDITTLVSAAICYRLDGEYEITEINKERSSFKLKENGKTINLVRYADQDILESFKGEIREYKAVEAYYITKPFTMGSLDYFKTIWSWTLTNDTSIPSELEVGVANNKIPFDSMRTLSSISKDKLGLDLNELDFRKVDLQKNIVPRTYTNQRILSQLKFICFGFRNFNNTNSVLSSMSIIYTIPFPSYGSD